MKKIIMLCVFLLLMMLVANSYADEKVVITTGSQGLTYFKAGHKLKQFIGDKNVEVVPSRGSVENIERIAAKEAKIGFAQMDAYAFYATTHPELPYTVEILGPIYRECVMLTVHRDSKFTSISDFKNKGSKIAVGKPGSGSSVTWDYFVQLQPDFKNATVTPEGGSRVLGKLASKMEGAPNGVMWVTKPGLKDELSQIVLSNKSLKFISVNDRKLNNVFKPTGKPIYEFEDVKSSDGFFSNEVEVPCMDAVVIADSEADERLLDRVSQIVMTKGDSLVDK